MYTRTFTRPLFDRRTENIITETVKISCYGFEIYHDNRLMRTGLVEDLEDTIECLIEEGFEEKC